jgi:phospholipid/cholesterol/gamma-HCH transport system substrate-binding protein
METRSNHILVGGVVLGLLLAMVGFMVWISGRGDGATKEFDIFFSQSVEGLNKGAPVTFSGVPAGEVRDIALYTKNPEFVRVRIAVTDDIPVLLGTTAAVAGVGLTGGSQIKLAGAAKGAPPIEEEGPEGRPVIPTRKEGVGALLNNAPQLIERLGVLTERLTELFNDQNQKSIGNTLANLDRLTGDLAKSGPDVKLALADARVTVRQAGQAANEISKLAGTTNSLVNNEGKPMIAELRKTAASAQKSLANLDAVLGDARPGVQAISTQTVPEIGQLVRDLRATSDALGAVATKIDQGGAGALLGGPALPDYKPGKAGK